MNGAALAAARLVVLGFDEQDVAMTTDRSV